MTGPVHTDELEWVDPPGQPERYGFRIRRLARAASGERLGCCMYEVAPGKRSWPYHYHFANEEAIFVLEGKGQLRLAGQEYELKAGDYVALPVGEKGSHQAINDTDKPLRFLCFSTMVEPDITIYPESDKIGLFGGRAPGQDPAEDALIKFVSGKHRIGYWENEE